MTSESSPASKEIALTPEQQRRAHELLSQYFQTACSLRVVPLHDINEQVRQFLVDVDDTPAPDVLTVPAIARFAHRMIHILDDWTEVEATEAGDAVATIPGEYWQEINDLIDAIGDDEDHSVLRGLADSTIRLARETGAVQYVRPADLHNYSADCDSADCEGLECVPVRRVQKPVSGDLCDDCPPPGYPTDKTRCTPCPRRAPTTGAK